MLVMYGGSFDPVHIGHVIVANEVYHQLRPDHFLFVPARQNPLKSKTTIASDAQRVRMLELCIDELKFGEVSTLELERQGQSYTYDTIMELRKRDTDIIVVIGTDQYEQLDKWYKIEKLKQLCTFVIVNRGVDSQHDIEFKTINIPRIDVSSTMLRERLNRGQTTSFWILKNVASYIRKERLYESKKGNHTH